MHTKRQHLTINKPTLSRRSCVALFMSYGLEKIISYSWAHIECSICHPLLWARISIRSLDSFLWGSNSDRISIFSIPCAGNIVHRGAWGVPPSAKLEWRHMAVIWRNKMQYGYNPFSAMTKCSYINDIYMKSWHRTAKKDNLPMARFKQNIRGNDPSWFVATTCIYVPWYM
jgi:hypothetical protein